MGVPMVSSSSVLVADPFSRTGCRVGPPGVGLALACIIKMGSGEFGGLFNSLSSLSLLMSHSFVYLEGRGALSRCYHLSKTMFGWILIAKRSVSMRMLHRSINVVHLTCQWFYCCG